MHNMNQRQINTNTNFETPYIATDGSDINTQLIYNNSI